MKKFLIVLLSFVSIFAFSGCKQKEDLNSVSKNLTEYEISINLNTEKMQANANQNVNFVNNTNSILKNLKLHLYPQNFKRGVTNTVVSSTKLNDAYPNGMSYAEFEVTRLTVEDKDSSIIYEGDYNDILSINLNESLMPNENVEFSINFSFTLPNCHHRFGYGKNTINLANFYPIICVYENGEFNTSPYNSNGDPFYSDIANYSVNITTDNQYIVAGTGEKTKENLENNKTKTQFKATAVRDFALVLSNKFETLSSTVNNTKIEYYYFNDTHAEDSLKAGVDAIKTFNKLFGTYPYKTFSIVKTDFVHGGMEYPNLIMISSNIENKADYLNVIIHETAHQWWYGIVGNDEYKFPWLDEALTEYSTILFYDNNEGYNLNHKDMVKSCKENYSLFVSVYEEVLGKIDTSMRAVNEYETEPEYTYCTYVKGVLMYDSLYNLIGENKFVKSLNEYFKTYKFKNATPKDLISCFEKVCKQDLTTFFNSWITGKVVIK